MATLSLSSEMMKDADIETLGNFIANLSYTQRHLLFKKVAQDLRGDAVSKTTPHDKKKREIAIRVNKASECITQASKYMFFAQQQVDAVT